MAPLQVSWFVRMCVIVIEIQCVMQFVRQKLGNTYNSVNFYSNWKIDPSKPKISASPVDWSGSETEINTFLLPNAVRKTKTWNDIRWWSPHWDDILNLEILKKKFHPSHAPYGGMFLEVKNPKNRTPKVVCHPNRIFKSHQFVVIILIHLYIHSSRQTIGPRDTIYVTYY